MAIAELCRVKMLIAELCRVKMLTAKLCRGLCRFPSFLLGILPGIFVETRKQHIHTQATHTNIHDALKLTAIVP